MTLLDIAVDIETLLRKFDPSQPRDKKGKWSLIADFSSWTKVGERLGSNPGGVYKDGNGQKWYVKQQRSDRHASNEAIASALYKEYGANVPEVVRGEGAPGLDGPQTATRWEDIDTSRRVDELDGFDREDAQYDFAADAWLANWDVVGLGFDNLAVAAHGGPIRLDQGGALEFRARGEPKGAAFGDKVTEWDALRDPIVNPQSAAIFGDIDDDLLAVSAERLHKIEHRRIRQLVKENGGDPELAEKLISRRTDILRRAELIRMKQEAAKGGGNGSRGEKAGMAAMEATSVRLPDRDGGGATPDLDAKLAFKDGQSWDEAKLERVSRTTRLYRAGLFRDVGDYLRGQSSETQIKVRDGVQITDENVLDHISALDEAMEAATLSEPVEVYRGIWKPEEVFGDAWTENGSMEGVEWDELSFPSTSFEKSTASSFSAGGVLMRVHVPAGTGAVVLSGFNFNGAAPRNEAELLLDRNIRMRVTGDGTDDKGHRLLDVDVLPGTGGGRAMAASSGVRSKPRRRMTPGEERITMNYKVNARRPVDELADFRPRSVRAIVADELQSLLREFNELKVKRDRKGRFAKSAAQVVAELDDMIAKLSALQAHLGGDEDSEYDHGNALDSLKELLGKQHERSRSRTLETTNGDISLLVDGDGDINFDFDNGSFFVDANQAREIAKAIDQLQAMPEPEVNSDPSAPSVIGGRVEVVGGMSVLRWQGGAIEIASDDIAGAEELEPDVLLVDEPDEAKDLADVLEELAEAAEAAKGAKK